MGHTPAMCEVFTPFAGVSRAKFGYRGVKTHCFSHFITDFMRKNLIAALLSTPLLALAVPTPQAINPTNLVVNGSFETTPTTLGTGAWTIYSGLQGWTVTAGNGIEVRNGNTGTAALGSNFVELDTTVNSTIAQAFASLSAGSQYLLRFQYSPRIGVNAASNHIAAYWNGVQIANVTGAGAGTHVWSEHSFNVRAVAGVNTLSFAALGTSDSLGGSLDNVRLNAIPEPATLGLALAGVAGVLLMRRRRQA